MIARISGILLEKYERQVLVDVQGVGYEIEVPTNTLAQLPPIGKGVVLNTHFVVREDVQQLFGFFNVSERSLFRILIKINGVGPKMGLAILSGISVHDLVAAVQHDDVKALVRLPGVGKKTAERLIIELRDKLKEWSTSELNSPEAHHSHSSTILEAENALVSLGYKPQEASRAISAAVKSHEKSEADFDSGALIRMALKKIG